MAGTVAAGDTGELPRAGARPATDLAAVYAAHASELTRALHAAGVPDPADAVQEAFVQAVVHWRRVSRYDDPLAWIRRVAINRGHNRRRAHRRQRALARRVAAATPAAAPDTPAGPDNALAARVASLPDRQRLALSLFYFADLSVAEVADAMSLSAGAVKYHLHAARSALARALEQQDDG